jgi:hypothetical protein
MAEPKKTGGVGSTSPNDFLTALKRFDTLTLVGLGLGVAFVAFLIVPDWRLPWLPNFIAAAGSGYLLWSQGRKTKGLEEQACKWGLLIVAALFLWRDYYISEQLQTNRWWFGN